MKISTKENCKINVSNSYFIRHFYWWISPIIKIGRDKSCNVIVDDILASKIQNTLKFTPNEGWILYDGDFENERKPSTNSTWVYREDDKEIEIKDNIMWKCAGSTFQAIYGS